MPVVLNLLSIEAPDDGGKAIESAAAELDRYSWLVFTSVNTVERFAPLERSAVAPPVAAIGPATATAARAAGFDVQIVPPAYVAESLVEVFPEGSGRVLLPRAQVARDVLPNGLRDKGWTVDVITAYKTVRNETVTAQARLDAVTFTASSTVEAFVESGIAVPPIVACIGPIAAETAREAGMRVDVVASEHTMDGLVSALSEFVRSNA